jgi:hypothetical protein
VQPLLAPKNVDLAIEFDKLKIPERAWWCVWDDHFGDSKVAEESVGINNGIIRKFIPFIEETVVGFSWTW